MKINFAVRAKNKTFWLSLVPAALLLFQTLAAVFGGIPTDFGDLGQRLTAAINALFAVLTLVGVVADPTTKGLSDSERAMSYTQPQ